MMRAAFAYMDWTEHFDGPNAIVSPTRTQDTVGGTLAGPSVEGGQVIIKSYGAKTDTFFNSKWQFERERALSARPAASRSRLRCWVARATRSWPS